MAESCKGYHAALASGVEEGHECGIRWFLECASGNSSITAVTGRGGYLARKTPIARRVDEYEKKNDALSWHVFG